MNDTSRNLVRKQSIIEKKTVKKKDILLFLFMLEYSVVPMLVEAGRQRDRQKERLRERLNKKRDEGRK
jgi:hypothetical protein